MKDIPYRRGHVFVQDHEAGIISETDRGYEFIYLKEYLQRTDAVSVSLTLPLRAQPFESTVLFPFFDGLIPEGWLLNVVVHNWKIDPKDRFGLLLCTCHDCIGDVRVESEDFEST